MVSGSVRLRSVFVGEKLLFSSLSAHQSQSRSQQPRYETPPNKETREIAPTQSCLTEPQGSCREDNLLMIIIDNFPSLAPPPPPLGLINNIIIVIYWEILFQSNSCQVGWTYDKLPIADSPDFKKQ